MYFSISFYGLLVSITSVLTIHSAWAQQPSYQRVGADFLEDKEIYSLLADSSQQLWIGTDDGLYAYNGKEFKAYSNSRLRSKSVFSPVLDAQNRVYYCNLMGQIMRMEGDSLHLYYELPDSLIGMKINMQMNERGDLLIVCKKIVRLTPAKVLQLVYSFENDYLFGTTLIKRTDGAVEFAYGGSSYLMSWKNEQLQKKAINYDRSTEQALPSPIFDNNVMELRAVGTQSYLIYHHQQAIAVQLADGTWQKRRIPLLEKGDCKQILMYHLMNNGQLWCSCRSKGGYLYNMNSGVLSDYKLFPDYRISAVLETNDGKLWMGSLKQGLLLLPHRGLLDFKNHPLLRQTELLRLAAGRGDTLYALGANGSLYQIDPQNKVQRLTTQKEEAERYLIYAPSYERFYFNDGYWERFAEQFQRYKATNVRSVQFIGGEELLIADYSGVYVRSLSAKKGPAQEFIQEKTNVIPHNRYMDGNKILKVGRAVTAHFQPQPARLWIATTQQLIVVEAGDTNWLHYQGQPIYAKTIVSHNDSVFVGTNRGILLFVQGAFSKKLTFPTLPLLEEIEALKYQAGQLYIAGKGGFQRVDVATGEGVTINRADGLPLSRVRDFTLQDNFYALLTNKGVQKVARSILNKRAAVPSVYLQAVEVNDEPIDWTQTRQLSYQKNKIAFRFHSNYYYPASTLRYRYRLLGAESTWQSIPFEQGQVQYNALAAGNYVFEVQAQSSKGLYSEMLRYAFSIAPPFWRRWWFFLGSVLGVGGLVSLVFIIRIRVLKRQNALLLDREAIKKQLVESQQTALRAQMNPHFMFNALNSIQEMIMMNNKKAAGSYLGKFADLMRLYLYHSQQDSISLEEELKALRLYLELEQVRFEESLTIDLQVAPDLDSHHWTLPPMLLQPYIENAFKHGLLHRTHNRHLKVAFLLDKKDEQLRCVVEDNGVGRTASAKINQARAGYHQSFSTSATRQRLELLNYNRKNHIQAVIEDLVDATGRAAGTRVVVTIPNNWEAVAAL